MFGMMDFPETWIDPDWECIPTVDHPVDPSFVVKLPSQHGSIPVYVDDKHRCRTDLSNARRYFFDADWYILPLFISFFLGVSHISVAEVIASLLRFPLKGNTHCLLVEKTSPHTYVRRGCTDSQFSRSETILQEWAGMDEEMITML
jgi:hypothetical protein